MIIIRRWNRRSNGEEGKSYNATNSKGGVNGDDHIPSLTKSKTAKLSSYPIYRISYAAGVLLSGQAYTKHISHTYSDSIGNDYCVFNIARSIEKKGNGASNRAL